jgi:hypothetical protein
MTWRRWAAQTGLVDVDAFVRDGYVVIRGAFAADTAAACRAVIWNSMSVQRVRVILRPGRLWRNSTASRVSRSPLRAPPRLSPVPVMS